MVLKKKTWYKLYAWGICGGILKMFGFIKLRKFPDQVGNSLLLSRTQNKSKKFNDQWTVFSITEETLSVYKYTVWYTMGSDWVMDCAELRGSYATNL